MKDKLNHILIQKEEIDEKSRPKMANEIFGPGGLADSNDTFMFESSSSRLKNSHREYEQLPKYYESCLKSRTLKMSTDIDKENRMNSYGQTMRASH